MLMELTEAAAIPPAFAGASDAAIRHHYDVGTDFYRLWLGEGLVYSGARWRDARGAWLARTLDEAQTNKIDYHLSAIGVAAGDAVLDIGCGWGALLRRAVGAYGVRRGVGLTLSRDQFDHVRGLGLPRVQARLQSYETFAPRERFDGIVSIGAFEHFARPDCTSERKHEIYRGFFERCHDWLKPGGGLSLQTICWGDIDRDAALRTLDPDIFPDSDLPYPEEALAAAAGPFALSLEEEGGADYRLTLERWLESLRRNRRAIEANHDADLFARYEGYLRRSIAGFARKRILLRRWAFVRR